MIELQTKPFGKIQISEKQLIYFREGLLGFASEKQYALIEDSPDNPFKWLQSTENTDLAFVIMQPQLFLPEYKPLLPDADLSEIKLDALDAALILTIVTIPPDDPSKMTANLQGPIIINAEFSLGRQCISRDESHYVRTKILENFAKLEKV